MVPTGGDLTRHDHEFDQVKWLSLSDAPTVLTFETERALVARAAERLVAPAGAATSPDAAEVMAPGLATGAVPTPATTVAAAAPTLEALPTAPATSVETAG
jgi:hypothetical protein